MPGIALNPSSPANMAMSRNAMDQLNITRSTEGPTNSARCHGLAERVPASDGFLYTAVRKLLVDIGTGPPAHENGFNSCNVPDIDVRHLAICMAHCQRGTRLVNECRLVHEPAMHS